MEPHPIPEEVLRFIHDYIDSVPQLETLLLMWEAPSTEWTEAELARRVYVTPERVRAIVQDLVRHGAILPARQSPAGYVYNSAWSEAQGVAKVEATYRRHLVYVANLIHTKASSAVREFARAFEMKKKD